MQRLARTAGAGAGGSSRRTHYDVRRSPSPLTSAPRCATCRTTPAAKIPALPPLRFPRQPGAERRLYLSGVTASQACLLNHGTRHQRGPSRNSSNCQARRWRPGRSTGASASASANTAIAVDVGANRRRWCNRHEDVRAVWDDLPRHGDQDIPARCKPEGVVTVGAGASSRGHPSGQ